MLGSKYFTNNYDKKFQLSNFECLEKLIHKLKFIKISRHIPSIQIPLSINKLKNNASKLSFVCWTFEKQNLMRRFFFFFLHYSASFAFMIISVTISRYFGQFS